MAKSKKKRNKKYTGADAASTRPSITRVQAVSRNPASQWLHEKKRVLKIVGTILLICIGVAIIISGIVSLF